MKVVRIAAIALSALLTMPAVAVGSSTASAASAPYVPCPAVKPAVPPPAAPSPPPVGPADLAVGGETLATPGLAIPAGASMAPSVTATSWVVADLDSGAVLGGCGPHEHRTPASVQKMLLAAALMPHLDPAQMVEVTRADLHDLDPASSVMGVVEGGRYSVESLWLGLLLKSGNDAANVLARVGGGTAGRQGGVQAMNDEAHRLGANQTHAATPSGLDGPGQYTSAYDLALIARATYARADFRRYIASRVAEIPAGPGTPGFSVTHDNTLLDHYPGTLGGKTGFTDLARQTYVGVAERNGRRLAVTLLGAETAPLGSLGEAAALLDWGFALPTDASVGRLVTPDEKKHDRPVAEVRGERNGQAGAGPSFSWSAILGLGAAVILAALLLAAQWRQRATRRAANP
ncbi:D-alanyl-D-alanine carboxypeptidase (penicillin-binding protein 5/6) [Micromonospora purpureochromogenes]|uniref:D-alanyl-D-alanine carboxypeptidase (Penicillin-binding protein 5/6) n=1 Tax=Micromonospora purpureochromogenes TaxID=47872 RepID=A0A1C4ZQM2_9ACTN|nr:serine hydrolase [Micromonospora purpureochromogenes]SCF35330.1 D-alanyl-D-alanine carboxypeptidase (penicillin-binding protein 5/6) [Micromonospora purpureochromogenes]